MTEIVLLLFTFLIGIVNITSGYHVTRLDLFDLCTSATQISIANDEIVVIKIKKNGNGLPAEYKTCSVRVKSCEMCDSGLYYSFPDFRVSNHNVRVKVETVTPKDGARSVVQFGDFLEPVPWRERFANRNATLTLSWLSAHDDDFMIEVNFYTGNLDLLLLDESFYFGSENKLRYILLGITFAILICVFVIIRGCYNHLRNVRNIKRLSPLGRRRHLLP